MEKKLNLEEILINTFPEEESGYSYNGLNNVIQSYIKRSMLEFGKQLLELSSENACGEHCTDYVDKKSITNTINQVI